MINETRTLNETTGKVEIITKNTIDRYTPRIDGRCDWICEDTVENIKSDCKIYVPRGDYRCLSTMEMDYNELDGATLQDDLAIFQKELNRQFGVGKYEAFVLGAYIHSGTSFSVNKSGNHVCRWDSSQLGFIGLRRDKNHKTHHYTADRPDLVEEDLTNAWEGQFEEYQVYDELNEEIVDSCVMAGFHVDQKWVENAEKTYGISFDGVEPIY